MKQSKPSGQIQRQQHRQSRKNQSGAHVLAALGLMTVAVQHIQPNTFASAAIQHEAMAGSQHQTADGKIVQQLQSHQQHQSAGHAGKLLNSSGLDVDSGTPLYQNAIARTLALMKKKSTPSLGLASPDSDASQSLAQPESLATAQAPEPKLVKPTTPAESPESPPVEQVKKPIIPDSTITPSNDQADQKQALAQEGTKSQSTEEKASISEVAAALSGNVTEKELSNGKLVDAEKNSSLSFAAYAESQAQALSVKHNKSSGKAKAAPTKPAGGSGKRAAASEKLYDKALTSRTTLPADADDAAAGEQTQPSALPESPKATPALQDPNSKSLNIDDQQQSILAAGSNLAPAAPKTEEALVAPALSKQSTTQSLVQATEKEAAGSSAAAGTDDGLIDSLMQQNPSLSRASAAQLAQSLIEKELGTSQPQTPPPAPAPAVAEPAPIPQQPITPPQQLPQSLIEASVGGLEPEQKIQPLAKAIVKSDTVSHKDTYVQNLLQKILKKKQKQQQKDQTSKSVEAKRSKIQEAVDQLKSGMTVEQVRSNSNSPVEPAKPLAIEITKMENVEPAEPKAEPALKEKEVAKQEEQTPTKQTELNPTIIKSLQATPQVAEVSIVTEKPLDPAQYASQITDSLIQPLQQEAKKDEQPEVKPVAQPPIQALVQPVAPTAATTIKSLVKSVSQSQSQKIKNLIQKAKIEKIAKITKQAKIDKIAKLAKLAKQAKQAKQQKPKVSSISNIKVEQNEQNDKVVKEPITQAQQPIQSTLKPIETLKEVPVEAAKEASKEVAKEAPKPQSLAEQSSGDQTLAVKHTLALLKAQKLNKDLLEYNKLLSNKKDETEASSNLLSKSSNNTSQQLSTITNQQPSADKSSQPAQLTQSTTAAQPQKPVQQVQSLNQQVAGKTGEQSKKDTLIKSIQNSLALSLMKVQAVAETGSSTQESTSQSKDETDLVDSPPQSTAFSLMENVEGRKRTAQQEAQRVLDEANSISEQEPATSHLVEVKGAAKTAVKASASKSQKLGAQPKSSAKKAQKKQAGAAASHAQAVLTDADDFASKTARLLNGDLTMAGEDIHVDESAAAKAKGKKTLKLHKLKMSSGKAVAIKPTHLGEESAEAGHATNLQLSSITAAPDAAPAAKGRGAKKAKKEKTLNAGKAAKGAVNGASLGGDSSNGQGAAASAPPKTPQGATNRAAGDCPTGVACPIGSAGLWPGVVGQHSQTASSAKGQKPALAQKSFKDIIAKKIALAKYKKSLTHGRPKAKVFLQLEMNEQNHIQEQAKEKSHETQTHKGGISNKAAITTTTSTKVATSSKAATATNAAASTAAKTTVKAQVEAKTAVKAQASTKTVAKIASKATTKGKSEFIDGWDERKDEFMSKKDRKEEGAIVLKTAFSMHEVNGGSQGEKPDDQEIKKTLDKSFNSSKTESSGKHSTKSRTVQKPIHSLQQSSDDEGEPHHHKGKAKEPSGDNTANNKNDGAPDPEENKSSRKPNEQSEEAVKTALDELNSKSKPFSKDIPNIQQEEGDVLSYSDHVSKSEDAEHIDSQDSVSELMRAKASVLTKRQPRKKVHQSLHQVTQKDSKDLESDKAESEHTREADLGDEEKYLKRLRPRGGEREVAHEAAPMSVYEGSERAEIESGEDGHVESDLERVRETEKAGVSHYEKQAYLSRRKAENDIEKEEKHPKEKHHRAQKTKKSNHEDEHESEEERSPGDYAKEVKKRNNDVYDDTEKRNREAISYEHHDEPDETNKTKDREDKEERERREKEEMKEHEREAKKTKEDDPADYHKEVKKVNTETFKSTEQRNRDAISHEHHEEPEEHDAEKAKAQKDEQERGEKERTHMMNDKIEEHPEEGYGTDVRNRNTETFDDTEKRNREAVGAYSQKVHKHRAKAGADAEVEQEVEESYKAIAQRNEDALAEHYKPSEPPSEKKSEETASSDEPKSSFKFKSSSDSDDKKKEQEHESKEEEKSEEKDTDKTESKAQESKPDLLPKHPKLEGSDKKKEIKLGLKDMKKALDSFQKSSREVKSEVKEEKVAEEAPKTEITESITSVAKQATSMETVMEEELKGLTSEIKKKEEPEEDKKDEPAAEPAKEEVKEEKKEEPKEEESKEQEKREEESKEIKVDAPKNQSNDKSEKIEVKKAAKTDGPTIAQQPKHLKQKHAETAQQKESTDVKVKPEERKKRQQEQLYGKKKKVDRKEALKDITDAKDQIRKALKELEASGEEGGATDIPSKDMETLKQFSKDSVKKETESKKDEIKQKAKEEQEQREKESEAKKKAEAKEKERTDAQAQEKKAQEKADAEEKANEEAKAKDKKEAEEKEKQEAKVRADKEKKEKVDAEAKAKVEEDMKKELQKKKKEKQENAAKLHQSQEKAKHDAEEKAKKEKEEAEKVKEKEKELETKDGQKASKQPEFAKKEPKSKEDDKKEESKSIKSKLQDNMNKETDLQKKVGEAIDSKLQEEKKADKTQMKSEQKADEKKLIAKDSADKEEPKPAAPDAVKQNTVHHEHHQSEAVQERQKHIQEQVSARLKEEHRPGMIFGIPNVFEHAWSGVKWIFGMK